MFFSLLFVNMFVAFFVSVIVIYFFAKSVEGVLSRIINDNIYKAWVKYIKFSGIVVGLSSGIRIYDLEKYITPLVPDKNGSKIISLNFERWFLEVFRTVIETIQGLAWMFLIFFMVALLAYVIVRLSEIKHGKK